MYVERATVENVPGVVGSRTDEYVIVKMRFTVSIETVGKTHDAPPTSAFVSFPVLTWTCAQILGFTALMTLATTLLRSTIAPSRERREIGRVADQNKLAVLHAERGA